MNEFLRIDVALDAAMDKLRPVSDSPRLDAELLLARALDVQRSYIYAHPEQEMDPAAATRFLQAVDQRVTGMPMAYISGEKEFWSMTLLVSPDTLVPRADTEILVDQALIRIPRKSTLRILDLGTGSGAVALAIAKERPACDVTATDISASALAVARENARRLALPNIEFVAGNWFEPVVSRQFDVVVGNPPYVAESDPCLEKLAHEPRLALASGHDGLDAIRHIARNAATVMVAGSTLLLEHGETQAASVAAILGSEGWVDIRNTRDLAGLPRVTSAEKPLLQG